MKISTLVGVLLLSTLVGLQADQTATTAGSAAQTPTLPAPTDYRVVDLGANHRVWQRETYEQGPGGQVMTHIHSYTELASGMNYRDASGQWTETKELIESFPSGAVARQGQYQIIFANNLNSAGSIDMQTTDGKRLRSNILGLMYVDTSTGDAVVIASVQDSTGELISDNQVLYPNAFAGVTADVRYTYKRGSFEQDVILREQPPTPESYGLNPATTELEVFTEFIDPPSASVADVGSREPGLEADQSIKWGATRLGNGRAFNLGDPNTPATVSKRYVNIQGRHFLLEKVMFQDVKASLSKLPEQSSNQKPLPGLSSQNPVFPKTPTVSTAARPIRLAAMTPSNQGYVLDYVALSMETNDYVLQGNKTYYISSAVNIDDSLTIEGGAVVKYNSSAVIQCWGPVLCKTSPYRPAVFTYSGDTSVGEDIGIYGSPDYTYYAFYINNNTNPLSNLRISYADYAIVDHSLTLKDSQLVNCLHGLDDEWWAAGGYPCCVTNVLMSNVQEPFYGINASVFCCNVTIAGCQQMFEDRYSTGSDTISFVNSILVGVTNFGPTLTVTTNYTASPANNSIFQTVGAGSYYLATNSPYRNVGTTNIGLETLTDLAAKTTYPPIVYSNVTISATMLSPQAQRDTDTPDLGYHYDPLDYVIGGCDLYTNLTLAAGTAVGSFQSYGNLSLSGQPYDLSLNHGANLISTGIVTQPNWIVYADTVQEGGNGAWTTKGWLGGITINDSGSGATPQMNTRFTKWATLATEGNLFRDNWAYGEVRATHDEFYNGGIGSYWGPCYFTNCLFHYNGVTFWDQENAASLAFQNCTFYQGGLALCRYSGQSSSFWNIQNTTFDGTAFLTADNFGGNTNDTTFDYNAYNSSNTAWASYSFGTSGTPTGRLETAGVHDVIVTNFNWQTSWLGDYYLPSNSLLIDAGSTTADQLGLYHFTTQTDQTKETNSIVDIGYHYVAVDGNGNPIDSDGDGIPDYLEDVNGNGVADGNETDWQNPDSNNDGISDGGILIFKWFTPAF